MDTARLAAVGPAAPPALQDHGESRASRADAGPACAAPRPASDPRSPPTIALDAPHP